MESTYNKIYAEDSASREARACFPGDQSSAFFIGGWQMKLKDISGQRFNRLTVLKRSRENIYKNKIGWVCRCDCGNKKTASASDMKSGKVKSCGCAASDVVIKRNKERRGKKSDRWNGGEIKINGYVLSYAPNHPRSNAMGSGYVKRSRLIMEGYLGRLLDPFEIVHHCNHKRDDDRIENLELMSNSSHLSLHHKNRPKHRDCLGKFSKGGDAKCLTTQK